MYNSALRVIGETAMDSDPAFKRNEKNPEPPSELDPSEKPDLTIFNSRIHIRPKYQDQDPQP